MKWFAKSVCTSTVSGLFKFHYPQFQILEITLCSNFAKISFTVHELRWTKTREKKQYFLKFSNECRKMWPGYSIYHYVISQYFESCFLFCTATCEIFIEPPPDTQRTERQGERGIWVAMGCYLLHVTPLPPPPPSPLPSLRVCRTACGHVIRIRGLRESPPPLRTPPIGLWRGFGNLAQSRGWPLFWRLWVW